ncbi:hypothetical protein JKP88DRAFT_251527 [Tribonema minus]|uniref:Uncharacterized protein n=1 Tax=Tribonema minus TaxID=303371 RepID=A0A836CN54_9STRA|nr:hypothetical protein JKP88DRAFT_251527 [Tribonema minus]
MEVEDPSNASILHLLLQLVHCEETSQQREHSDADHLQQENQREEAACALWDMSANARAADVMLQNRITGVLEAVLDEHSQDLSLGGARMQEIAVGILANLAAHKHVQWEACVGKGRLDSHLFALYQSTLDPPTLTELLRLFTTLASRLELSALQASQLEGAAAASGAAPPLSAAAADTQQLTTALAQPEFTARLALIIDSTLDSSVRAHAFALLHALAFRLGAAAVIDAAAAPAAGPAAATSADVSRVQPSSIVNALVEHADDLAATPTGGGGSGAQASGLDALLGVIECLLASDAAAARALAAAPLRRRLCAGLCAALRPFEHARAAQETALAALAWCLELFGDGAQLLRACTAPPRPASADEEDGRAARVGAAVLLSGVLDLLPAAAAGGGGGGSGGAGGGRARAYAPATLISTAATVCGCLAGALGVYGTAAAPMEAAETGAAAQLARVAPALAAAAAAAQPWADSVHAAGAQAECARIVCTRAQRVLAGLEGAAAETAGDDSEEFAAAACELLNALLALGDAGGGWAARGGARECLLHCRSRFAAPSAVT